jgi:hypothetical protein
MADPFDRYREALVVEMETLWSLDARAVAAEWEPARRKRVEQLLHAGAAEAAELNYVRVHSGFCRQITVQTADLDRLQAVLSSGV